MNVTNSVQADVRNHYDMDRKVTRHSVTITLPLHYKADYIHLEFNSEDKLTHIATKLMDLGIALQELADVQE